MLHQRNRFLMHNEHVNHPMLQDLKFSERHSELLTGFGIFQSRGIELSHCPDGVRAECSYASISTGLERGDPLALLAEQIAGRHAHPLKRDLRSAPTVD